jgi:hypothetical protein
MLASKQCSAYLLIQVMFRSQPTTTTPGFSPSYSPAHSCHYTLFAMCLLCSDVMCDRQNPTKHGTPKLLLKGIGPLRQANDMKMAQQCRKLLRHDACFPHPAAPEVYARTPCTTVERSRTPTMLTGQT